MTSAGSTSEQPAACPSCGAAVRHYVPWCLQCYASLEPERPQPERRRPEPAQEPEGGPDEPPVTTTRADIDAIADRMLAELARDAPLVTGVLARLPESRSGRLGVAAGLVAAFGLVILLVMTVLGHLL